MVCCMSATTASAIPPELDLMVLITLQTSDFVSDRATRASAAVENYLARCQPSAAVADPGPGLGAHGRSLASLAAFTATTSTAFVNADNGTVALSAAWAVQADRRPVAPPDVRALERVLRASGGPVRAVNDIVDPDEFAAYAAAVRRGEVDGFGADWGNDGCSDHGAVTRGYDKAGCVRHDFAYRNWFRFEGNETLSNKDAAKKLQAGFDARLAADSVVLGMRAGRSEHDATEHGLKVYYGLRLAAALGRARMTQRPKTDATAPTRN